MSEFLEGFVEEMEKEARKAEAFPYHRVFSTVVPLAAAVGSVALLKRYGTPSETAYTIGGSLGAGLAGGGLLGKEIARIRKTKRRTRSPRYRMLRKLTRR